MTTSDDGAQSRTANQLEGLASRVRGDCRRVAAPADQRRAHDRDRGLRRSQGPARADHQLQRRGAAVRAEPGRGAARHRREPRRLRPAPDPPARESVGPDGQLRTARRRRARRRTARPHARPRRGTARPRVPLPRPVGRRAGPVSRPAGRGRARRRGVAAEDRRARGRRDLRVGGRTRRRGAAARGAWPHGPPVHPGARGIAGPAGREVDVSRARDPGGRVRERGVARRPRDGGCARSASPRSSRPGAAATTARARSPSAGARTSSPAFRELADGRPADPRGDGAVRPRALGPGGPRVRTATCAPGRSSRTATPTASCGSRPRPCARAQQHGPGDRDSLRGGACSGTSTTSGCSRSSCSRSARRSSRTRWRRGYTTPVTGRSRAR